MSADGDGFIGRWSRRKAETSAPGGLRKKPDTLEETVVAEPVRGRMITEPLPVAPLKPTDEDSADPDSADAVAGHQAAVSTVKHQDVSSEDEPDVDLEELEGIDIEALDFDADFTKFMQPGVPERLRQRALQRLWSSNPILANVDGLNDYDEDFSDAALAVDALKSAWKVGQGYLTDEEVEARDAERLGEPDGEEGELESPEDHVADAGVETEPDVITDGSDEADAVAASDADSDVVSIDPGAEHDMPPEPVKQT